MPKVEDSKETSKLNELDFELDYDTYAEVSRAARLESIKLIGSTYKVLPMLFEAAEDNDNMKQQYSGHFGGFSFDAENGVACSTFQWVANIKSGRKSALKLKSDYLVIYLNLEGKDEGHVKYFLKKVGRFATYPYFRALFSQHASETGIMLPPLPTLSERVD